MANHRPFVSPTNCQHHDTILISGGHGAGVGADQDGNLKGYSERHEITLCRGCGTFRVFKYLNGETLEAEFWLNSEEAVEAAGRYVEYINHQDRELQHIKAL